MFSTMLTDDSISILQNASSKLDIDADLLPGSDERSEVRKRFSIRDRFARLWTRRKEE
jgi:hypothetical protein